MLLHESIERLGHSHLIETPLNLVNLETSYKAVTEVQIDALILQGNSSTNWEKVFISEEADARTLSRIRGCTFGGVIFISVLLESIGDIDGVVMPSGLYDSCFAGRCFLSKSCHVSRTTMVSNVHLGEGAGIINCGFVTCKDFLEKGSLGYIRDTLQIDIGPETGGRHVEVIAGVNFVSICKQLFNPMKTPERISSCAHRYRTQFTIVGDKSLVIRCDRVYESLIGPGCRISSASLDTCILLSTPSSTITVSPGARLSNCILNEACSIGNNSIVENVYLSENSSIGECARVAHSVLGPDSSVAGGECHHSLLGPFVGFHHQSLLIATVWPQGRGNIAYGAKVGANHTGRVSDQECWPGEGTFFGLDSSIKFPSNLLESPYSIIAPATVLPSQKLSFPFSLVSTADRPLLSGGRTLSSTACTLSPGWVIQSNPYMIDRFGIPSHNNIKFSIHQIYCLYIYSDLFSSVLSCCDLLRSVPLLYFISFYFILLYFILFYFILFYFILFYFILFYFILFYFSRTHSSHIFFHSFLSSTHTVMIFC